MGNSSRIDKEVLKVIEVNETFAYILRETDLIYVSNEDTLLNNGSLDGVNLKRVFYKNDFLMVTAINRSSQWSATSLRSVGASANAVLEFVTHALVTEVLSTGVRLFSRILQKPIDAAVDTLPELAKNAAGAPSILPHQTVVVRVRKEPSGESYAAVAVEVLPLLCGKGVIYLVREEFSVILYNEPAGNERLPFRYVLAPNDVIKANNLPPNDWYGRPVEFFACIDQPDGSEEFLEGRRYKAVEATIADKEPRTTIFRSRGVFSRRDDAGSPNLRTGARNSIPADVLSLDDRVLTEWRMVQKQSGNENETETEGSDQKEGRAPSAVGGTVGHSPLQLPRQTPTGSSDGVDEEVSAFTSEVVFASLNPQGANATLPPIVTSHVSAPTRPDIMQSSQGEPQNVVGGGMAWDSTEAAEQRFQEELRRAQEESLRLSQQQPIAWAPTNNDVDDELERAIAISMEEERRREQREREREEREIEDALKESCQLSDKQMMEALALSRHEALMAGVPMEENEDASVGLYHLQPNKVAEPPAADVDKSPPVVDEDQRDETNIKHIVESETTRANRCTVSEPQQDVSSSQATVKEKESELSGDLKQLLVADSASATAAADPIPPLSTNPVDVNAFLQRQLEEFLSAPKPSHPVAKPKETSTSPVPVSKNSNVDLLFGLDSAVGGLSSPTLTPVLAPTLSPTTINWSSTLNEPKTNLINSNKDEKKAVGDGNGVLAAGAQSVQTLLCETGDSDALSSVDLDNEERSTVELIEDDEIVDGATQALANGSRNTGDDQSDDGSLTPTPEQPLPEGISEELSRVAQSEPVYNLMLNISSRLAGHSEAAGLVLRELQKFEKKK